MEKTIDFTTRYEIKGFYFGDNKEVYSDTHFHYDGSNSMIDHQREWSIEAEKIGYHGGELDEAEIIKTNYKGKFHLTDEQILSIINDGKLMDTPFTELFPHKIDEYIKKELKTELNDLIGYVTANRDSIDCTSEKERIAEIKTELAKFTAEKTDK